METGKGFLGALFDFSFSEFITKKVIRILYIILVLFCGLGALFFIFAGFAQSVVSGLLFLIISPLIFLLYVILIRIALEIYLVIFQIGDHTREIAEQGRHGGGTAYSAGPK